MTVPCLACRWEGILEAMWSLCSPLSSANGLRYLTGFHVRAAPLAAKSAIDHAEEDRHLEVDDDLPVIHVPGAQMKLVSHTRVRQRLDELTGGNRCRKTQA